MNEHEQHEQFLREHEEWKRKRRDQDTPASRERKLRRIENQDGRRMKLASKGGAR